jgi:tetratricopeptide (TPR) repeat protein
VDGFQRGIALYRRAIDQDPMFAPAYEGLAACYADWAFFDNAPATDVTPLARAAATRALELDSTLGLPHATLAWIRFVKDLDFVGPDQEFRRALALSPGSSWIQSWYGSYLTFAGRFDDAIRLKRQAVELDPLSVAMSFSLGVDLVYARRYDESIAELRRTLDLNPNEFAPHLVMAADYALKGMLQTALVQCDSGVALATQQPEEAESCAWINARAGRRQEALVLLQQMTSTTRRQRTDPIEIAKVYENLGDRDRAIAWLRRAARERFATLVFVKTDPILDPLRSDPRFQALLRELKMAS